VGLGLGHSSSEDAFSYPDIPQSPAHTAALANILFQSSLAFSQANSLNAFQEIQKAYVPQGTDLLALMPCVSLEKLPPTYNEALLTKNEKFPGKVCGFCNLGSRSALGQGELIAVQPTKGFSREDYLDTLKVIRQEKENLEAAGGSAGGGSSNGSDLDGSDSDEESNEVFLKSPPPGHNKPTSKTKKSPTKSERTSGSGSSVPTTAVSVCLTPLSVNAYTSGSASSAKSPRRGSEVQEEINTVGYPEEPELSSLFDESSGNFYVHASCATWSMAIGVRQCEFDDDLDDEDDEEDEEERSIPKIDEKKEEAIVWKWLDRAVLRSLLRKCHYCQRYGASVRCRVPQCLRYFHFPCAAAAGAFQDGRTSTTICPPHLQESPLIG
jgi:histone-lysine N-methyltransferase MLL3